MANSHSDRNLLLGVLALQFGLVTREQLIAAISAWGSEPAQQLDELFLQLRFITDEGLKKLRALLKLHLQMHGGDVEKSLAALSSVAEVRHDLEQVGLSELEHSLRHLSRGQCEKEADPFRTETFTAGQSSTGTRFRILRPHAKGGLGEVSVAVIDSELNREVALKEIQRQHADEADNRSRFLLEAQITGGLEHPGIVPVYGMGTYADGRPFYAMRFIRGDSLKEAIQKFHEQHARSTGTRAFESFEFRKLLQRFIDVCNAIAYAHARGVLHRDLKPGNIMLGHYGETLVVDWGLAKATGNQGETADTSQPPLKPSGDGHSAETVMGSAFGTPGYMSPEQAAGRVDLFSPATDIYCLGATLYHLLTGKPPHTKKDDGELLKRIQAGDFSPPREINKAIPTPLAAICLQAMATKPADRYASALALAADIEHWLADDPVTAHRDSPVTKIQRWSRRHRTLVTSAAALLITAVVTLAISYFLLQSEQGRTLTEKKKADDALLESKRQLAANFFQHGLAEYDAGRFRNSYLELFRAVQLTHVDDARSGAYRHVLLDRIFAGGRAPGMPLTHEDSLISASLSPDGTKIVTVSLDSAQLWNRDGMPIGPRLNHRDTLKPQFSPDGTRLLLGSDGKLRVWEIANASYVTEVMAHPDPVFMAGFSPDGANIVTQSGDAVRIWDAKSGKQIRKLDHPMYELRSFELSPKGRRLLIHESNQISLLELPSGAAVGDPITCNGAVFNPSGSRLLTWDWDSVQLRDTQSGMSVGKPLKYAASIQSACFSHDGRMLLVCSGTQAVVWRSVQGNLHSAPLNHSEHVTFGTFSPDDSQILTISGDQLLIQPLTNLVSPAVPDFPPVSPDAAPIDAGPAQPLFIDKGEPVTLARYTPDGQYVATERKDGSVQLRSSVSQEILGDPIPHDLPYLGLSSYDLSFLTSPESTMVRCWAMPTPGTVLPRSASGMETENPVRAVSFDSQGQRLLTTSTQSAQLWDATKLTTIGKLLPFDAESYYPQAQFSRSGSHVLTYGLTPQGAAGMERIVNLWNTDTGAQVGSLRNPSGVRMCEFSPDGAWVVTVCENVVRIWKVADGTPVGQPIVHPAHVHTAMFDPSGSKLVTACSDKLARIWSVPDGKLVGEPLVHAESVNSAVFSPDGARVLTSSGDHEVRGDPRELALRPGEATLWDARTGKRLGATMKHQYLVMDAIFSPDGERVLSADEVAARLWHGHTGAPIGSPMLADASIFVSDVPIKFSEDSRYIVTICGGGRRAGQEQEARMWDGRTAMPVGEPLRHNGNLTSAAFNPDGSLLVTGSDDSTTCVWLVKTGTQIGETLRHAGPVTSAVFSPDGKRIVTGCRDGSTHVRELDHPFLRFAGDEQALRLLTDVATRSNSADGPSNSFLSQEEWLARWKELQSHPLWQEHLTDVNRRRENEHAIQADAAERRQNWFAAAWHLEWMVKKEPGNAALQQRWEAAKQKLAAKKAELDAAWEKRVRSLPEAAPAPN